MKRDGELRIDDGRRLSESSMAALARAAEETVSHMFEAGVFDRAAEARRIRSCVWEGQHWDERMYGDEAFPFKGASDLRVRTADRAVRVRVAEAVTALLRAQLSFGSDLPPAAAQFLSRLWRRTLEGEIALQWLQQMSLLSLYVWGGGRAAAGLWIGWDESVEWTPVSYDAEALASAMAQRGVDPDAAAIAMGDEETLASALSSLGIVRAGRARAAAREFLEGGTLHAAEPRLSRSRPALRALELGVDLFVDPSVAVGGGDDADAMHLVEWLSPVAMRQRALQEDWDESFARELEERAEGDGGGEAVFPEWDFASPDAKEPTRVETIRESGRFQVVTSYVRALGPGGVPGRYRVVWCPALPGRAARPADLVKTPWGGWPVMLVSGEVRGPGAMDGAGIALRMSGLQTQQKLTSDMLADLSMLQLPPVTQKGAHAAGAGRGVLIEPLALNSIGVSEELSFMTPPQLPQTSLSWLKEVRLMIAEAADLPHEGIAPELTGILQEERLELWLRQCAEAVKRVLALVVERAGGGADASNLPPGLAEAAWPVTLRFNPRAWDMEYMERLSRIMNQLVVPLDRTGRLNLPEFVSAVALDLMPTHAELLKPADEAARDERADEEGAYMKARAGIRSPVPEGGGADYGARLAFYEELFRNPQALADVSPDKRALVEERVRALQFQMEQQRNAEIGRVGVAAETPAPESAGEAPAGEGGQF